MPGRCGDTHKSPAECRYIGLYLVGREGLERPGKPKWVLKMNWAGLEEAPVRMAFNSHLRQSFSGIPVEVGGIEPEWSMFKASIAEAAAESCGLGVIGASRGSNP